MRSFSDKHSKERRWIEKKMETEQQLKTKPVKKEGDRAPDEMYVFRCPNPECGKVHFSMMNSMIEGAQFGSSCPGCGKSERMVYHLVYAARGKILLRACCGVCRKEHSVFFPGIRRICERCGWEGEFFIVLQKSSS